VDAPDHSRRLPGSRRFDEFQESLGISRNVLTDRLNRLVEEGIFEASLTASAKIATTTSSRAWARPPRRPGRSQAMGGQVLVRQATDARAPQARSQAPRSRARPKGTIAVPIGEAEFVAGPGRDPNAPTWRVTCATV